MPFTLPLIGADREFGMINISLFENATDSLNHGLEHLRVAIEQHSSCDYKQAILLFSQSAELFLKQLLSQINPVLVFDKNSLYSKCEDWYNPKLTRCAR